MSKTHILVCDEMAEEKKIVMISSTSLDLPEHRKEAIDACLRQGAFPIAMEHLPARDADAIKVSTEMVDKADIYIGIYAWRYGHVPEGFDISITEMEFNRAVERSIPILVFTIHDDHFLTIAMVEADKDAQEKLKKLKERARGGRCGLQFHSPVDLRSHIIQSLGALLKEPQAASPEKQPLSFHPPNRIPPAPAPYIAHPYSLLETREVVGRRHELNLLTDWVTANKEVPRDIRLFNVVAIGGMGKSALTWKWFNDDVPNELPHLAGRMWWSFYESDDSFENFIIRALAYTAGTSEDEARKLPSQDREDQLFQLLDQKPFLLVLDGLERILIAYSRMDAAHLPDDDLDDETGNALADIDGIRNEVKKTYLEKHRLRLCADPRAGRFLRRMARVFKSRVLISTRLYPVELQTNAAQPSPGCYAYFIDGLSDDEALALWREFLGGELSGTTEQLLPLFHAFGNYPLLVRALAGEVAEYRHAPKNFDRWCKDHPDFNPASLPLKNVRTHVLEFALGSLGEMQRRVLHTIAAFSMPANWDTLRALLVGEGKPCRVDRALDEVLTELEDRGLVGWDKRANRYDLHPIVRGVVWSSLGDEKQRVYRELHDYFEAVPKVAAWREINKLEDLTPAIELYRTLTELRRYDSALAVFRDHISESLHFKLSASRLRIDLLKRLFLNGVDQLPYLSRKDDQAYAFNALAVSYSLAGEPGRAVSLFTYHNDIRRNERDTKSLYVGLDSLSDALRLLGSLRASEAAVRQALIIAREMSDYFGEAYSLWRMGMTLATRGLVGKSKAALQRSLAILQTLTRSQPAEGAVLSCLAQCALWLKEYDATRQLAYRAWVLAHVWEAERDFVRAARRQGAAALGQHDFDIADERLHHALARARQANFVEEELAALIGLAELRRQQGKPDEAREFLDDIWDSAERGPYPLFHADACNVLAQIERDAGNLDKAIAAAIQAHRLAWCDGPPFAYHWGLIAAQKHLRELDVSEPEMPPFDESKFEPMPEVEIDPEDEPRGKESWQ